MTLDPHEETLTAKMLAGGDPRATKSRPAWLLPTPPRSDEPSGDKGLRHLVRRLMQGENLRRAEAAKLLNELLTDAATDAQIAAALVALAVKGETVEELAGMAQLMRSLSVRLRSGHARFIDTAGTGSSRAKTFNVSTAAAFVIAGAGVPVAKHGSRAATSRSGSADVLAALGVNTNASPEVSEASLNECGICFMFAPLYHAATARVAGIRRELGVHTTFNLLGPLTNPAGAPCQIIGVWHKGLLELMAHTLLALGTERAWVVHGADGLDEVTTSDATHVAEVSGGRVRTFKVAPEDFGLERNALDPLRGGDAETNAKIIRRILNGESSGELRAARDLVIANAAAALYVGEAASDLKDAAQRAAKSITSGAAREKLGELIERTNS